jgi:hypothetical protein
MINETLMHMYQSFVRSVQSWFQRNCSMSGTLLMLGIVKDYHLQV